MTYSTCVALSVANGRPGSPGLKVLGEWPIARPGVGTLPKPSRYKNDSQRNIAAAATLAQASASPTITTASGELVPSSADPTRPMNREVPAGCNCRMSSQLGRYDTLGPTPSKSLRANAVDGSLVGLSGKSRVFPRVPSRTRLAGCTAQRSCSLSVPIRLAGFIRVAHPAPQKQAALRAGRIRPRGERRKRIDPNEVELWTRSTSSGHHGQLRT